MKTCICLITKDSQDIIEEFIEWHHNHVGIQDIILIEDYNSFPLKDIVSKYDYVKYYHLSELIDEDVIKFINTFQYKDKVHIIYYIFHKRFRKDYDWLAFIDDDEFIDIDKDTLYKILERNQNQVCITMPWLNMKCDGHIYHPNHGKKYSLLNTYKNYVDHSILRNYVCQKLIINCNPRFDNITRVFDFDHIPHCLKPIYNNYDGNIKLKHFKYKSFEEYYNLLKNRGECSIENTWYHRKYLDWFKVNEEYKDQMEKLYKEFNIQSENDIKFSNFDFLNKTRPL